MWGKEYLVDKGEGRTRKKINVQPNKGINSRSFADGRNEKLKSFGTNSFRSLKLVIVMIQTNIRYEK